MRYSTNDYRAATAYQSPLGCVWQERPHALVNDLCEEVDRLRAANAELRALCDLASGDIKAAAARIDSAIKVTDAISKRHSEE